METGERIPYEVENDQATKYWSRDRYTSVRSSVREILTNCTSGALLRAQEEDIDPHVTVEVEPGVVRVSDNGIGVPKSEFREKMIEVGDSDKEDIPGVPGRFGIGNLAGNMLTPEGEGFEFLSNPAGGERVAARFFETDVEILGLGDEVNHSDYGTEFTFELANDIRMKDIVEAVQEIGEWLSVTVELVVSEDYEYLLSGESSVVYPVITLSDYVESFKGGKFEEGDEYLIYEDESVEVMISSKWMKLPDIIHVGIPMEKNTGINLPDMVRCIRIKQEQGVVGELDGEPVYIPETPTDRERFKKNNGKFEKWVASVRDNMFEKVSPDSDNIDEWAHAINDSNVFWNATRNGYIENEGDKDIIGPLTKVAMGWTRGRLSWRKPAGYELYLDDDFDPVVVGKTMNQKRIAVLKDLHEDSIVMDLSRKDSTMTYEDAEKLGFDRLTDYPYDVEGARERGASQEVIDELSGENDSQETTDKIVLWKKNKNLGYPVGSIGEDLSPWEHLILFPEHDSEWSLQEYRDLTNEFVMMANASVSQIESLTDHNQIHSAREVSDILENPETEEYGRVWVGEKEIFELYQESRHSQMDELKNLPRDLPLVDAISTCGSIVHTPSGGIISSGLSTYVKYKKMHEIKQEFAEYGLELDYRKARDLKRASDWIVDELRECYQ